MKPTTKKASAAAKSSAVTTEAPAVRVKVSCKDSLRGWKLIAASEVKPSDNILARYPR